MYNINIYYTDKAMKQLLKQSIPLVLLLGILGGFAKSTFAYTPKDFSDLILTILKNGDSDGLSLYFDDSIELKMLDREGLYSKAQTQIIVKNFFTKNTPRTVSVSEDNLKSKYILYNYTTSSGSKYKITISFKQNGDQITINTIRFDEA